MFREGKEGRERGRETSMCECVVACGAPPTGGLACNAGMCPDLGIEPVTLRSQAD